MAKTTNKRSAPSSAASPPGTNFRPGRSGMCEAQLWTFTGPSKFIEDQEIPVVRVAAGSLEQALKFMRRRYPDFTIVKAKATAVIALLSGSPFH